MSYRIDLFAIFIFLGMVQAGFLSFFFLSKPHRSKHAHLFRGIMLIAIALCLLEIFLMYSGYIMHCLYLVDFSEPFSFVLGPAFYLLIRSITRTERSRHQYWHFAFAVIYTILIIPFFLASDDIKYNAYVNSYDLDLPLRHVDHFPDPRVWWVTEHHTQLTLISLIIYALLGVYEVIRIFRLKRESFWRPMNPVLKDIRAGSLQLFFILALVLVVKYFNKRDTGDHLFAAYICIPVYIISFRVIRESGFFKQASLDDPARKSVHAAPQQQAILARLDTLMREQKPYLDSSFSLPDLAQQLNTSVHVLSQTINEGLGKSFFEMTAAYRVEEAKHRLKTQPHVKVEEIAEQVGYNSKSSFNTAFKKFTGQTPSEFRQAYK